MEPQQAPQPSLEAFVSTIVTGDPRIEEEDLLVNLGRTYNSLVFEFGTEKHCRICGSLEAAQENQTSRDGVAVGLAAASKSRMWTFVLHQETTTSKAESVGVTPSLKEHTRAVRSCSRGAASSCRRLAV